MISLETWRMIQDKQKELDQRIYQQAQVDWKWRSFANAKRLKLNILIEISEFANELKTFKIWHKKGEINQTKAQVELVDCLCFFLGLWNIYQIDFTNYQFFFPAEKKDFNDLLTQFFSQSEKLTILKKTRKLSKKAQQTYYDWLQIFSEITLKLQMNEKKLLDVYNKKNKINQQRVIRGY
ncbi:dUTP diphosphatase [endosymbiont GvMRE of Glomus versiforme]|uniref:dUTP diphosphatase n=1 Tax=endosymbiont GvMRE of Glomus versiforme TaxID=2039283 RepID=UPI000ECC998E|nr:dUTP diphosphatase [endosymbiont GvMRE of Glomus versiforme]RHZ37728.1 DUTP diphosphatase [endosymbiont GvMRE of Glomus versiforme]